MQGFLGSLEMSDYAFQSTVAFPMPKIIFLKIIFPISRISLILNEQKAKIPERRVFKAFGD